MTTHPIGILVGSLRKQSDMPAMQQPEAYIGNAASIFNDQGEMSSEATRAFLVQYLDSFARWVAKH